MKLSRFTRGTLVVFVALVILFLIIPLLVIVLFAFDKSNVQTFPIHHGTTPRFAARCGSV